MKSLFLHIAFLLSALLTFTSCIGGRNQEVSEKLSVWDSEVSNRNYFEGDTLYRTLLDSLDLINPKSLSKEDKAHYNLLHTILSDKSMLDFTSDSIIVTSVDYYQKKEDDYNLLRSLVYQGIVRYRIDEKDTSAFLIMKKAETLSSHLNENDTMMFRIKGLMYGTIGRMLFSEGSYESAEQYFVKSVDYFKFCNDENNYCYDFLLRVWCKLLLKQYDESMKLMQQITINDYPYYVQSYIFNTYSGLYHAMNDNEKSIFYRKKQISVNKKLGLSEQISDYYSLSDTYLKINIDSASHYAAMILNLADTNDVNLTHYYKQYANVSALQGYFPKAYDILLRSWNLLYSNTHRMMEKKVVEYENKYNYSEMKRVAEKERNHIVVITVLFIFAITLFFIVVFFMHSRTKYINQKNNELQSERDKLKTAYAVMIKNTSMMPDMIKKIDALSAKYISQNELSKDISSLSNVFRSNYRIGLSELSSGLAKSHISIHTKLDSLSDKESVIFFLSNDGYSSYEIAKMMCVSDSNVRVTLKKAVKKMANDEG